MSSRLVTETLIKGTNELVVWAFIPTKEWQAGRVQPLGTTLKAHPLIDPCGTLSLYGDYILTGGYEQVGRAFSDSPESWVRASFCRDYSAIDPATSKPYSAAPVLTSPPRVGAFDWPLIVRKIRPVRDPGSAIVSMDNAGRKTFSYRYSPVEDVVPPARFGTLFIRRTYLSNTPVPIGVEPGPVERAIVYYVPGAGTRTIPSCISDDLVVPELQSGYATYDDATSTASTQFSCVPEQHIPGTNFKTWRPFIHQVTPEQHPSGIWMITTEEVVPPPLPKTITLPS